MNFDLDITQQMLLESAEKLLGSRGTIDFWRARRETMNGFDASLWRQFAELGWLALPVPESAGGLGGSMTDVALLMTVFGKHNVIEPYVGTAVLGATILDRGESDSSAETLSAVTEGHARLALAHAEASDRHWTHGTRSTTAVPEGAGLRLHGRKMLVLDGASATHLIVTAALGSAAELALLILPRATDGITVTDYALVDGSRAADIQFDGVCVGRDALVAQGDVADAILSEAIDRTIVAQLAQAVGSMEACVDLCSAYVRERNQFGQPIGKFQALQHLLVDMIVAQHQSRSVLYAAIAGLDQDRTSRSHGVALAKIAVGTAMQLVSRTGIQLHGGYGLTDEYAISHHFRRQLVLEKSFGDIGHHVHRATSLMAWSE